MNKKKRLHIIYSILTILFTGLTLFNVFQVLFIHPPITDGTLWDTDKEDHIIFSRVNEKGAAARAGVQAGDTLIALNGNDISSMNKAFTFMKSMQPGDKIRYTVKRDDSTFTTTITLARSTENSLFAIIMATVGLLFLLVGYIAVFKKPYMRIPRLFYYFCFTFFLILSFNVTTNVQPWIGIFQLLTIAGVVLWGPSILHFFMNFPLRLSLLNKHPNIVYLLYLPSLLVSGYVFFVNNSLEIILSLLIFFYISFSFHLLFRNRHKITNPHEIKSIRLITWGMMVGLVPLGILALFSDWIIQIFGLTIIGIVYSLLIFVPIAFGYSIMHYGLMDIEIIIKKSLVYSILTSLIIIFYFGLVVGLGGLIVSQTEFAGKATNILFVIIVALAFQPVRNQIQNLIDRRFYRERYQYQKTLLQLSNELPGLVNIQEILKRVSETISEAMHVPQITIHLYDQKTNQYLPRFTRGVSDNKEINLKDEKNGLIDIIKKEKQACLFYKIEEDERYNNLPFFEKLKIEKLGIVVSIPLFYQSSLLGIISLGLKQSGQVYNQEDLDLLQTVAGNTAIALVNARLHQEDLRKQRFENELMMAKYIQSRLLPKNDIELPNIEIAGITQPATQVGGDYYDYIFLPDNRLLILVGDVAGKGMPAAIYMSKVQGMMNIAAGFYKSPKKLLMHINKNLYGGIERKFFVTMMAVAVDTKNIRLSLCRAGHMPVLMKRNGNTEFMISKGIGLGLDAGTIFDHEIEERQVTLHSGDFCLFYSDGLVETTKSTHEMYGDSRLRDVVNNNTYQTAAELQQLILDDVHAFKQNHPQNDDITIVILRVK